MTTKQRIPRKAYRLADATPLAQAVNQFLLDCEARNLTAATLRFYWQRLGLFVAFCDRAGVVTPEAITPAHLRAFLASFAERDLSPYYQHQHARSLKTFCGFLVRDGRLTVSPMTAVRMPKLPKDLLDRFASRADHLRKVPATIRFISAEPLLGPLPSLDLQGIQWVITGGESGPSHRVCNPEWVRDLRDRCQAAMVPFFHKQWGA